MGYPVDAIDGYYLVLTLLISIGLQYGAFAVAFALQFDKITDFMGGLNFFVIALLTLGLSHTTHARPIITSLMAMIWAFRLGGFLLFRVLQTGSDTRFDEMRARFWSFAGFWTFQFLWCWTVSLPVTIGNSPKVVTGGNPSWGSATDVLGLLFWLIGFTLETTADFQKYFFKSSKPPPGAIPPGVWRITRHPNYFGEILLWWGIWLSTLQPARDNAVPSNVRSAIYGSVVGPIFITLLLFTLSGFPTAEKPAQQKQYLLSHGPDAKDEEAWPRYKRYMDSTSIFWPIPPSIYRPLPRFVKTWILLDLPFYHFDEHRDGPKAIEEAEKKKRDRQEEA